MCREEERRGILPDFYSLLHPFPGAGHFYPPPTSMSESTTARGRVSDCGGGAPLNLPPLSPSVLPPGAGTLSVRGMTSSINEKWSNEKREGVVFLGIRVTSGAAQPPSKDPTHSPPTRPRCRLLTAQVTLNCPRCGSLMNSCFPTPGGSTSSDLKPPTDPSSDPSSTQPLPREF